jgi:hypothetical protein
MAFIIVELLTLLVATLALLAVMLLLSLSIRRPFLFRLWVTYTLSVRKWAVWGYKVCLWMYDNGKWPWSHETSDLLYVALAPITFPYAATFSEGDTLMMANIMSYLTGKGNDWRGVNPCVSKESVEQVIKDCGLRPPERIEDVDQCEPDRVYFIKPETGVLGLGHYLRFHGRDAKETLPKEYASAPNTYCIQEYVQSKHHILPQHIRIATVLEHGACARVPHFRVFTQTDPTRSTSNYAGGRNSVYSFDYDGDGKFISSVGDMKKYGEPTELVKELLVCGVLKNLEEAHQKNPVLRQHHSIGWDVVLTADGPVCLEINYDHGDVAFMQDKKTYLESLENFIRNRESYEENVDHAEQK